jgi:hypothetical protein
LKAPQRCSACDLTRPLRAGPSQETPAPKTKFEGRLILNAEDFFAALGFAAKSYFDELRGNANLQAEFLTKVGDPTDGVLTVVQVIANS